MQVPVDFAVSDLPVGVSTNPSLRFHPRNTALPPPPLAGFVTWVVNDLQSFLSKFEVLEKIDDRGRRTDRNVGNERFTACMLVLAEQELKSALMILFSLDELRINGFNLTLEERGDLSACLKPVMDVLWMWRSFPPLRGLARSMYTMRERLGLASVSVPLSWVCCFCSNGDHRNKALQGTTDGWVWTLLMPSCVSSSNMR